ncbi:MAG: porin [Luteimonas sp.]
MRIVPRPLMMLAFIVAASPPGFALAQENAQTVGSTPPVSVPAERTLTLSGPRGTVSVYGSLHLDLESIRLPGAAPATGLNLSRTRVNTNASNFGFRATSKPLWNDVNAWLQAENAISPDAGGGTLVGRNSGVGLASKTYGTLFLGQWDVPYKLTTGRFDPFSDTTIGSYSAIIGGGGAPTSPNATGDAATRASFDRRQPNIVQYWSPDFSGISAKVAVGVNEERTAATNPLLLSASLAYDNKRLYVFGAVERHQDYGALEALFNRPAAELAAARGNDDAVKVGAEYRIGATGFRVAGLYEMLKYRSDGLALERKVNNWYLTGTYEMGKHMLSVGHSEKANDTLSGNVAAVGRSAGEQIDTGAKHNTLRYAYELGLQITVYVMAVRLVNEARQNKTLGGGAFATVPLGADPQGFGVGLRFRF